MIEHIRIEPGTKPKLAKRDGGDKLGLGGKEHAQGLLAVSRQKLEKLQQRLYAEGKHSVLLVLQGLDASGKDGVIRTVFEGVNPQGCRVASFKAPTSTELAARLPLARARRPAGPRRDRHLQPLALRGRRRGADARAGTGGGLEAASGAHRRVGADARRRGNDDREGVPQRLARRSSGPACRSGSTTPRSAGSSARAISTFAPASTTTSRPTTT